MPFDGARWAIELAAVDKTAQAFASVERRMKGLDTSFKAQASMRVDEATKSSVGFMTLATGLGAAALGYMAVAKAREVWGRAAKAGDLGEQAEQLGVNTDQLQAYRFVSAQAGIETQQMDVALTKLAKSAGTAADGNKEMIERFQQLGVKLLDAKGELRPVADLLPEVARGVLNIGSSSERTATLMDLFGKSGAKMSTALESFAKGTDSVVDAAKAAGAVASPEIIQAWDDYSDAMKRAELTADVTYAKLGAPIATTALNAVAQVLKSINETMDQINSKDGFWASVLEESRSKGRIGSGPNALRLETPAEKQARRRAELDAQLKDPNNAGREAMIREDIARLNSQDIVKGGFYGEDMGGAASRGARAPLIPRSSGASDPRVKGGAGSSNSSNPYGKAIEGAKEYILTKDAETKAVGLAVDAAARLKHEQDLLNKVMSDGKGVTDLQRTTLQALAADMAQADATFARAKFMDDLITKADEFIATQQIERDTLYMSAEAAMAYRLEQEAINAAKAKGIELGPQEIAQIREKAAAQAAVADSTRKAKEWADFERETFKGMFSEIKQGLIEGQNVWDAFGNAGLNALDKISSKLMEMAADDLFNAAFGGGKGGGGGGGLFGLIGGLFGFGGGGVSAVGGGFDIGAAGGLAGGFMPGFATGGTPPVGSPYMVGERGPEVRVDSRPGHIFNREQWSKLNGGRDRQQPIIVQVYANEDFVTAKSKEAAVQVVQSAAPGIESRAVNRANEQAPAAVARYDQQRRGDWRNARG